MRPFEFLIVLLSLIKDLYGIRCLIDGKTFDIPKNWKSTNIKGLIFDLIVRTWIKINLD